MRVDARRMDDFFAFDRILVDAPCSGSGTLRAGDPKTAKRFTPALIEKSRKSQRALLDKGLAMLKVGGTLVYSTCSVLACENEEVVKDCLRRAGKRRSFEVQPIDRPGFDALPTLPASIEGALVLCPTDLYEGFFVVKIRRIA
jgi:ribosomal RNA methyltransferase Nop2